MDAVLYLFDAFTRFQCTLHRPTYRLLIDKHQEDLASLQRLSLLREEASQTLLFPDLDAMST